MKSMPLLNLTTTWTRKRRYEIFDWISARARDTIETKWELSDLHVCAKAWRHTLPASLTSEASKRFSRKFTIVSFRWLSELES